MLLKSNANPLIPATVSAHSLFLFSLYLSSKFNTNSNKFFSPVHKCYGTLLAVIIGSFIMMADVAKHTRKCALSLSLSHMHTHMHTHAMHTRSLTQAYSESHAYNVMSQVLRLQRHLGHTPWRILSHQDIVTGVFPIKHWKGWFWCQLLTTTKNGIVAAYIHCTLFLFLSQVAGCMIVLVCYCFHSKWWGLDKYQSLWYIYIKLYIMIFCIHINNSHPIHQHPYSHAEFMHTTCLIYRHSSCNIVDFNTQLTQCTWWSSLKGLTRKCHHQSSERWNYFKGNVGKLLGDRMGCICCCFFPELMDTTISS